MIEDWDDIPYDTPALDDNFHRHEMDVEDEDLSCACCGGATDEHGWCDTCEVAA